MACIMRDKKNRWMPKDRNKKKIIKPEKKNTAKE